MSEFKENLPQKSNEDLHIGLKVLSFCIPLAGAIITLLKRKMSLLQQNQLVI